MVENINKTVWLVLSYVGRTDHLLSVEILGVFDSHDLAIKATKQNDSLVEIVMNDPHSPIKFTGEEARQEFPHGLGPLRDEVEESSSNDLYSEEIRRKSTIKSVKAHVGGGSWSLFDD